MTAVQKGQLDVAKLLIKNKAKIDFKSEKGYTALHYACGYGEIQMVQLLLYHGSDVDGGRNDNGSRTLMLAADLGNLDVTRLSIENKAQVNLKGEYGEIALHFASYHNHIK